MKLSNVSVIFIIIVIPIILLLSYYISLQIDTINMQTAYNTKLLEATKEAIEAFEINTVEWNSAYSETADSKRRDIMASVNTFTTSFANATGVGGANKETILGYVPAIAFTLYDGYYIYSPAETKEVIKDDNGVAVIMTEDLETEGTLSGYTYEPQDKGKLLYKCDSGSMKYNGESFTFDANMATTTTYSHILKPFSTYSARYVEGSKDITVNYTLDNYITICGKISDDDDYVKKSGYLIDAESIAMPNKTINGIKLDGSISIMPEGLTEKIVWKDKEGNVTEKTCTYVYEANNNTKVYFDDEDNTPFQVSSTGIRTDLKDLSSVKYKKLSIYKDDDESYIQIYQALIGNGVTAEDEVKIEAGKWYTDTKSGVEVTDAYGQNEVELKEDTSAINYCVESYVFSKWVDFNLGDITVEEGKLFENVDDEDSVFNLHKREVIKQALISNLNQAITSYSRKSPGEFLLPVLSETDWDQILSNVSIITFVQGIPIGMKQYNNYAIATSTSNKEYVDPDEIYLNTEGSGDSDKYYHLPYCEQIDLEEDDNLIGYRSIDYKVKSYNQAETTNYYYKHDNISKEECYYCLVQRALYEQDEQDENIIAYETALSRERYIARATTNNYVEAGNNTPIPDPTPDPPDPTPDPPDPTPEPPDPTPEPPDPEIVVSLKVKKTYDTNAEIEIYNSTEDICGNISLDYKSITITGDITIKNDTYSGYSYKIIKNEIDGTEKIIKEETPCTSDSEMIDSIIRDSEFGNNRYTITIIKDGEEIATASDSIFDYTITSIEELNSFAYYTNNKSNNFNGKQIDLLKDIENEQTTRVANTDTKSFRGTFEGNDHTIKTGSGLFGYNGGKIKNVTVIGKINGNKNVGGIAGKNTGKIDNCVNKAEVRGTKNTMDPNDTDKNTGTGGIVGFNGGTIINCINDGDVYCNANGGGICGISFYKIGTYDSKIESCQNNGDVKVSNVSDKYNRIGGIAGVIAGTDIRYCVNKGTIEGFWITKSLVYTNRYAVGGIVGVIYRDGNNVEKCYNAANVKGGLINVLYYGNGGIVGYRNSSDWNVENNYYKKYDSGEKSNVEWSVNCNKYPSVGTAITTEYTIDQLKNL